MLWRCSAPKSAEVWRGCVCLVCRYLNKLALLGCHGLWPGSVWRVPVRVLEAVLDPLAGAGFAVREQGQQAGAAALRGRGAQWPWLQRGLPGPACRLSRGLHEDQPHLPWPSIRHPGGNEGELRAQCANAAADHWANLVCPVSSSSFSLLLMNAGTVQKAQLDYTAHRSKKNVSFSCHVALKKKKTQIYSLRCTNLIGWRDRSQSYSTLLSTTVSLVLFPQKLGNRESRVP